MTDLTHFYLALRERARDIVSGLPEPDFYSREAPALARSAALFDTTPLITELTAAAGGLLEDDFGHGLTHARKVALEAGALVWIEARAAGLSERVARRQVRLAHCAGLLHDIRRKQPDHAEQSARRARRILAGRQLAPGEIADVCTAIRNHEAFKPTWVVETLEAALLSDCLYDADKFRWGPDNFTDTLWAMMLYHRPTPAEFLRRFPAGMERLARIRATFRSAAGKRYGPRFIDLGLAAGEALYRVLRDEIGDGLPASARRPDSN